MRCLVRQPPRVPTMFALLAPAWSTLPAVPVWPPLYRDQIRRRESGARTEPLVPMPPRLDRRHTRGSTRAVLPSQRELVRHCWVMESKKFLKRCGVRPKDSADQNVVLSPPSGRSRCRRVWLVCAACVTLSAPVRWIVSDWLLGLDRAGSRATSGTGPSRGPGGQDNRELDPFCRASEVAAATTVPVTLSAK